MSHHSTSSLIIYSISLINLLAIDIAHVPHLNQSNAISTSILPYMLNAKLSAILIMSICSITSLISNFYSLITYLFVE
jgi:hypothetical protein